MGRAGLAQIRKVWAGMAQIRKVWAGVAQIRKVWAEMAQIRKVWGAKKREEGEGVLRGCFPCTAGSRAQAASPSPP